MMSNEQIDEIIKEVDEEGEEDGASKLISNKRLQREMTTSLQTPMALVLQNSIK